MGLNTKTMRRTNPRGLLIAAATMSAASVLIFAVNPSQATQATVTTRTADVITIETPVLDAGDGIQVSSRSVQRVQTPAD